MVKLFLLIQQSREAQILQKYFEQRGFRVFCEKPIISTYIKCIQYEPELIFLEFPSDFQSQIAFVQMLKKNEKTRSIPVLGYGNHLPGEIQKWLSKGELGQYYPRPLKVGNIVDSLELLLGNRLYEEMRPSIPKGKDAQIQGLLSNSRTASEKMEEMLRHVGRLFAFPLTISRICQVNEDEKSGMEDMELAISSDASVTATLLKVANSPAFSARGKQISDLREALVRIGFNETRNIAMSLAALSLVGPSPKTPVYNRMDFWYYALGSGLIAQDLSKRMGYKKPAEAFLVALLQDFGILLWDEFCGEALEKVIELTLSKSCSVLQAELEILGFTHHEFIGRLFEKWKMPPHLGAAVRLSQYFDQDLSKHSEVDANLVRAVGMSSIFAKALNIGLSCDLYVHGIPTKLMTQVGLPNGPDQKFIDKLLVDLDLFNQFLRLEKRDFSNSTKGLSQSPRIGILSGLGEETQYQPHNLYLSRMNHEFTQFSPDKNLSDIYANSSLLISSGEANKRIDLSKAPPLPILMFQEIPPDVDSLPFNIRCLPNALDLRRIDVTITELQGQLR